MRQGPLVAALGLVGAYAVPLLVESDAPHALPLFAYLAVVTAGSLAVLRHRAWWWLVWFSLAGATLWVPLWLAGSAGDPRLRLSPSICWCCSGLFVAFRRGVPCVGFLAGIADTPMIRVAVRAAFWALAACLLLVAHADHFGATSVTAATVGDVGMLALAYRDAALDDLIAVAGALARGAARQLEPAAADSRAEPRGVPPAAGPCREFHDSRDSLRRAARRRRVCRVAAGRAAGALGGIVGGGAAADPDHRLLAAAEIRACSSPGP